MKRLLFATFCLFLLAGTSCKRKAKSPAEHPVPHVPVNITMYPEDPLNFKLHVAGGWMYINGGVNGIIVYRKSQEEFVALERTSPHLPNDGKARAVVQNDNFTLRDTISGSQWRIFDGSVVDGPAKWPLKIYGTTYSSGTLRIIN